MCTNIVLCKVINYQMNLNFDFVNHSDITPSLETQTIPGLSKPEATCAKFQQTSRQTADKKAGPQNYPGQWYFQPKLPEQP